MRQQHCLGLFFVTSHYQVVEAEDPFTPIETHGCCGALCLPWLRLWAAGSHCRFQHSGGMTYPAYAHQDPPVKLRLRRLLLELKPLEEKYREAQQLVQQMGVHEVGLWVQAILEKPLPMHWMHNLSIHILGELLQLYPAIVTSEFSKLGMAQNYKIKDTRYHVNWMGL